MLNSDIHHDAGGLDLICHRPRSFPPAFHLTIGGELVINMLRRLWQFGERAPRCKALLPTSRSIELTTLTFDNAPDHKRTTCYLARVQIVMSPGSVNRKELGFTVGLGLTAPTGPHSSVQDRHQKRMQRPKLVIFFRPQAKSKYK
jgi:hypothetical protein